MLTLTTFGGLALDDDGRPVGGAAAQRRPLAVLAVIAAAGPAGASREKLLALLWPDADPERGRRTLTQTLYSLRRATHDELVTGTTELRLNAAVVTCDLASFDDALRAGRRADAVAIRRAPFLDGFALPGAPEFERWVEEERARIERRHVDALAALARESESRGALDEAASWLRRLVAVDPLDSTRTLALVDLLARAGDAAGAIRAARVHERLLRDQLDLALPPAIAARVDALVTEAAAARAERGTPAATHGANDWGQFPKLTPHNTEAPSTTPSRRRALGIRTAAAVAAGIALVAVGMRLERLRAPDAPRTVVADAPRADVVAVLPFLVDGAAELRDLGDVAAVTLSHELAGDVGPRAVDPGTVLAALGRHPLGTASEAAAWARARLAGRDVGAGEVLVGRVSGTPARVAIRARLLDVASGVERASADVAGPIDSVAALLDALAARVVLGRELGERAGAFASVSLPSLRAYLRGEAASRDDRLEDAVRWFEQALERDSTFALAALGLAEAADRFNAAEQHDRGLALAWAARDRLAERDRAVLVALAGPRYPSPSPAAEQLAAWERAAALAPDRASTWTELGERLLYDGPASGLRTAVARAKASFRRALALDPTYAPALRQLVEIAAAEGDRATLRALTSPERMRAFGGDLSDYLAWRGAIATNDSIALRRVRERMPRLSAASLRAIAMAAQHTSLGLGDGERALRLLAARAVLRTEQFDVLLAQHSLAMNQGRPVLALDVTERLQEAQPGPRAHLRLRVLDALYAGGDSAAAEAALRELAASASAPSARSRDARAIQLADACVLAQWRAAHARTDADAAPVRAAVAALRSAALPRLVVPIEMAHPACAELVEATLAVALRAPDARARVERLDALVLSGPAVGDARTYGGLVVASLYERLGDARRAMLAVRQRAYLRGWPRYLAASLHAEARLALAAGDSLRALAAGRRYLAFRSDPEAPLRGEALAMRTLVAGLERVVHQSTLAALGPEN